MNENFLLVLIICCEIGFWVVLFLGLTCRYILNRKTLSSILLISVPLIDVVLLAATVIDLDRGATATLVHGLAAAYIGFSIAFGHSSIKWVDRWFAHKFAEGTPLGKPPEHGWALARYELEWWLKFVLAVVVTQGLVWLAISYIDDPVRSEALNIWLTLPWITVALWFVFGPLWVMLFNRKPTEEQNF